MRGAGASSTNRIYRPAGFTLIELLVVIAIVGVLKRFQLTAAPSLALDAIHMVSEKPGV